MHFLEVLNQYINYIFIIILLWIIIIAKFIIIYNSKTDDQIRILCDKYKIYPQHIPNVQCHVPGIYSSNIYGLGYSKSTAVSIKGDYSKEQNCTNEERFKSTNQKIYTNRV